MFNNEGFFKEFGQSHKLMFSENKYYSEVPLIRSPMVLVKSGLSSE